MEIGDVNKYFDPIMTVSASGLRLNAFSLTWFSLALAAEYRVLPNDHCLA
jgi:hypothetical protein